jgi:hypothetical protein
MGVMRNAYKTVDGKSARDRFGNLAVDGTILKWSLKKQGLRMRTAFIWPRIGTSDGLL